MSVQLPLICLPLGIMLPHHSFTSVPARQLEDPVSVPWNILSSGLRARCGFIILSTGSMPICLCLIFEITGQIQIKFGKLVYTKFVDLD
jgi:hypothetical protein